MEPEKKVPPVKYKTGHIDRDGFVSTRDHHISTLGFPSGVSLRLRIAIATIVQVAVSLLVIAIIAIVSSRNIRTIITEAITGEEQTRKAFTEN